MLLHKDLQGEESAAAADEAMRRLKPSKAGASMQKNTEPGGGADHSGLEMGNFPDSGARSDEAAQDADTEQIEGTSNDILCGPLKDELPNSKQRSRAGSMKRVSGREAGHPQDKNDTGEGHSNPNNDEVVVDIP